MQTLISSLSEPLTPWLMAWSTVGALALGAVVGAVEGFYQYVLKRPAPWPTLVP